MCPTKIGKQGSTETRKHPTLVKEGKPKPGRFCIKCGCWFGCLGNEPSVDLYVSHLVQIFSEVKKVLRDDGILWVNIADSYAGGNYRGGGTNNSSAKQLSNKGTVEFMGKKAPAIPVGLKPKDMCLVPQRLVIALQDSGWYIRSTIIWHRPNQMPQSATDRPTTDFEYVFMLAKSKHYWYDQDAVRQPYKYAEHHAKYHTKDAGRQEHNKNAANLAGNNVGLRGLLNQPNPAGRNLRTTLSIDDDMYVLRDDISAQERRFVLQQLVAQDVI